MEPNPYSSPSVPSADFPVRPGTGLSEEVIRQLGGTKPWVRLFSVLNFVGTGLMVFVGIAMLVSGFVMTGSSAAEGGMKPSLAFMAGGAIFYFILGGLAIWPGIKLWKYANRIVDLMENRSEISLERALDEQRGFWKFAGISVLLIVGLYVIVILGVAVTSFLKTAQGTLP